MRSSNTTEPTTMSMMLVSDMAVMVPATGSREHGAEHRGPVAVATVSVRDTTLDVRYFRRSHYNDYCTTCEW